MGNVYMCNIDQDQDQAWLLISSTGCLKNVQKCLLTKKSKYSEGQLVN